MIRQFFFTQKIGRKSIATVLLCALYVCPVFALQESTGPDGSNVQAVHAEGFTGQGISIGLISQDHSRITHEAFDGHAHWYDATDENNYTPSSHDTSVGGIICSRGGALYPNDKGTAHAAELYSYRVARNSSPTDPNKTVSTAWIQDALDQALSDGCKVIVTGIQLSTTSDGSSIWSRIYDYYAYEHNLIFATAAGNYSSAITVFGDTYNSITTGGLIGTAADLYDKVGTGSNPGPTTDDRRKPDISAPSQSQWVPTVSGSSDTTWKSEGTTAGQTSWAVPHTGGVTAVLLEYANTITPGDTDDNRNEVIKAVIVNSAFPNILDKDGNSTVADLESESDWPWNTDRGYGRIDAKRAYETLSSPKVTHSININQPSGWTYRSFGYIWFTDSYWIYGTKNSRLVVTMNWNRYIDSNYNPESTPLNMDMDIFDPLGASVFSEHLDDTNPPIYNNLRKADILLKQDGYYEVKIENTIRKSNRAYALAFEVLPPLEGDYDTNYIINNADFAMLAEQWLTFANLSDLLVLAGQWLNYDPRYYGL